MRSLAVLTRNDGSKMNDAKLGIDVSKATLDTDYVSGQRKQARNFTNDPDGWQQLLAWLKAMGSKQAHVCMEATGRHSLGLALALHDAGHVVSIVNPAQIRDFARTKLGRNKTDKVDAARIREYAELFEPAPWAPPSPAMRRLCELQTVRAGLIGSRTEWTNRIGSGLGDDTARKLAAAIIEHFTAQLVAVDKAIAETIDQDAELRRRRDLLLSVVGVGETLAGLLLAELPEPGVLRRSSEVVAYAGLNPSHHRSGKSIDRPTRISKIGNAALRSSLYMPALAALQPRGRGPCGAAEERGPTEAEADCRGGDAQAPSHLLRRAEDRQTVRTRYRNARLSRRSSRPIQLTQMRAMKVDHSDVLICPPTAGAQRMSRRAADPRQRRGGPE